MTYYIVTKEGVYRHEIMGLYSEEVMAMNRANNLSNGSGLNDGIDKDDYHSYTVSSIELDVDILDATFIFDTDTGDNR